MSTTNTVIQSLKKSMDNETVLFHMSSGRSIAFNKGRLFLPWDTQHSDYRTLYSEVVSPRLIRNPAKVILYKNSLGIWMNLSMLIQENPSSANPFALAEMKTYQRSPYIFDTDNIPEVDYETEDGQIYTISRADGAELSGYRTPIAIDECDSDELVIEQYSIDNPSLAFSKRHLMDDLKFTLVNHQWDEVLLSINGKFVPITGKGDDVHEFYVRDGKGYLDTRVIDQRDSTTRVKGRFIPMRTPDSTFRRCGFLIEKENGNLWRSGNYGSAESLTTFTKMSGITNVKDVAGSYTSSTSQVFYFLLNDGRVKVFGANSEGMLGLGSTVTSILGNPITHPTLKNIVSMRVSSQLKHALFMNEDGELYGCGANTYGCLGLGHANIVYKPTLIDTSAIGTIKKFHASDYATTAIIDSSGNLWIAGYGQFGVDSYTNRSTFTKVILPFSDVTVVDVKMSMYGILLLLSDGTIATAGKNRVGILGRSLGSDEVSNVITRISGMTDVVSIYESAGSFYAMLSDYSLYAWGNNTYGQLGIGTTTSAYAPVQVESFGKIIGSISGRSSISFMIDDGHIYSMGYNAYGELGFSNSTTTSVTTPTLVTSYPMDTTDVATVWEESANDNYRYDFKARLFKWKNVKFTKWYAPAFTKGYPVYMTDDSYAIVPWKLTFPVKVSENAHLIFVDGKILPREDYDIDPTNTHVIILNKVVAQATVYMRELVAAGASNPVEAVRTKYTYYTHYLVNATSSTDTAIRIERSRSCAKNFPYKDEVTFDDFGIHDTMIVDGSHIPAEWIHTNTLKIPKAKSNSWLNDRTDLGEADVYKLAIRDDV